MKLLLTLTLLTGCATGQYYAGHYWVPDPSCIPAKSVQWLAVDQKEFDLQCGSAPVGYKRQACTKHWEDKAYIYSTFTEMQAESIDADGISLKAHEYLHAEQCFGPHPT